MARRLPMLLAVLAAGLLVLWWSRGRRDDSIHASPEAPSPVSDAPERPASELTLASDASATEVREPVSVPQAPEEKREPSPAASDAVLVVHAVAKGSLVPLPRVRMSVLRAAPASGSSKYVEGTRGGITTSPHTGADGVAEFDLPAGIDLRLTVRGEDENVGREQREIDALTAGERREITIELATGDDQVFFGRVLSREDGSPLAGASVRLVQVAISFSRVGDERPVKHSIETVVHEQTTGPDGLFELSLRSWENPDIHVQAPGFARALVKGGAGHDTPETARPILLSRSATLRARLLDAGAAVVDGSVSLWTESYHLGQADNGEVYLPAADARWRASADGSGMCVLSDLPPDVPFHVEVSRAGHEPKTDLPTLSLDPGEVREIEWSLGTGCRIEGSVTDQLDRVVAGQTIWLQRTDFDGPRFFQKYHSGAVVLAASTDEGGRFVFDDVSPGKWWVGPAAERNDRDAVDVEAIAPVAQVVEVREGSPRREVALHVHRGIYIRGRVLDPAGNPVPQAFIQGQTREVGWLLEAQAAEDGAFAMGPLVPGRYSLEASGSTLVDSEAVVADAGDEDVVLRLRTGGTLKGTVLDGANGKSAGGARLTIALDGALRLMTHAKEDGSFVLEGLAPGTYDLFASASGPRVGVLRGATVQAGGDTSGLVITLLPGARLRVKYAGTGGYMNYSILSDGVAVEGDGVAAGSSSEAAVPAGHLVVVGAWLDREELKELDLAVGDDKEIVFGP